MNVCEQIQKNTTSYHAVSQVSMTIGNLAKKAMLDEVYTTPKPGLVDCYSNGAHTDMNLHTFQKSAEAITPYIMEMCEVGAYAAKLNEDTFAEIRKIGLKAEKAMYQATNGVNTHKGMIFSMGILATAAGYCISHEYLFTENTLLFLEQKLVKNTLQNELKQLDKEQKNSLSYSNGEQLYCDYGIRGIRGEAIAGYESVRKLSLPVFRKGIQEKQDYNLVKLQTLLVLMKRVQDSNVAARRGKEGLQTVHTCAERFLSHGGAYTEGAVEELKSMDAMFIVENISCGGCADLLAVTIFIYELLQCFTKKY